jgi:hypothetical protein
MNGTWGIDGGNLLCPQNFCLDRVLVKSHVVTKEAVSFVHHNPTQFIVLELLSIQ